MAVAGLRGTGDWGPDQRPKNFRELIAMRNPAGSAPLFALTSKIGSESVDDPEFNWWDESSDLVRLQINGALAAGTTAIAVDSSDPDAANPGRHYGLATHLKPGDLLMVERPEAVAHTQEIMMVQTVTSPTAFSVTRGVAGTTAIIIPDDAYLLKIGSAYEEGSLAADARTRNPTKYSNFCQIFKTSYELTNTAKVTHTRTGDPLSQDMKRKTFDHSRDIELAMMFGQKFETVGPQGKPLRYMGGLREFIPADTTTIFGSDVTARQYLDSVSPMFDWDTGAGDERVVFCGNGYLNTINELAKLNGDIRFGEVIKLYGMNMVRYVLPQGELFFRRHPLMNRHPQYRDSAFIVDFASLKYRHLRDTKKEDNIQATGQDSDKGQWLSEISLEVSHGGLTCGYHGNFNSVAP